VKSGEEGETVNEVAQWLIWHVQSASMVEAMFWKTGT
jgi:hypothetical protein